MYLPKPLKQGDTIGLINLSSYVPTERIEPAIEAVKALGFAVKVYESATARHATFAGTDEIRARDFTESFCDDEVDGIFCIRGGYGAARALELVDWERVKEAVKRNPKYFSGYSDVTAAHVALNQICNLVTYHTPMPSTEYYKPIDDFTMRYLKAAIAGEPICRIENPQGEKMECMVPGMAKGTLIGGNLSLLTSAVGTPFDTDTKGKILFIEDIGESPYRIDRMLTQLKQAGKLKDAAGIIIGAWTDCNPEDETALTLDVVMNEIIKPIGIPVISNLRCGHCLPTVSLPMGMEVCMDADACTIEIVG